MQFILTGALAVWCIAALTPHGARAGEDPTPRLGSEAPKWIDRHIVRELLELAETRRIDIVGLGDSNQLFNAHGWQDGWTYALGQRYPMYATPILGAGANNGIGLGMGVNDSPIMPPIGAPVEWAIFNNPLSGVDDTPYGFLTAVVQARPGLTCGMRLTLGSTAFPLSNFNADHKLRMHFSYTVGPIGALTFYPGIRQALGLTVIHAPISNFSNVDALVRDHIDYPAGVRNENDIEFNWFQGGSDALMGPFVGLYMRFEDIEQPTGFSNHTLYWTGGASARLCAVNLQAASDTHLIEYFRTVRELQPAEKKILIRIAFGGNDRTDSEPSVGPEAGLASNTPKGVSDNLVAIMNRIREIWQIAGWDEDELTFLLVGNHAKPVEPNGFGFRDAIADLARQTNHVAFVNLAELSNPLEMTINGWYYENGAHLTVEGYEAINTREVAALIDLPEDLNDDCVVDTSDLAILLGAYGILNPAEKNLSADFNFDGTVDTSDLGRLLSKFGVSCP
ncbi:MAG: hypothetical protein H6814_07155 [Phycisphaeraceae bacterium]|nr:hypothetical protein [Phycisphaeraceae bacterium]